VELRTPTDSRSRCRSRGGEADERQRRRRGTTRCRRRYEVDGPKYQSDDRRDGPDLSGEAKRRRSSRAAARTSSAKRARKENPAKGDALSVRVTIPVVNALVRHRVRMCSQPKHSERGDENAHAITEVNAEDAGHEPAAAPLEAVRDRVSTARTSSAQAAYAALRTSDERYTSAPSATGAP